MKNINELKLIAQGAQSKIYEYDDGRVLRVPQNSVDYDRIEYEYNVYKTINNKLLVPKVHELLYFNNVPCILMERVDGPTLTKYVIKNLFRIISLPRKLVSLHIKTMKIIPDSTLITNHEKAKYCIDNSRLLTPQQKGRILYLLESLGSGEGLCHGDFHPDNIIIAKKTEYIIDWSAASRGHPAFDVANTFLVLINLPVVPGWSLQKYKIQRFWARILGYYYLKFILRKLNMTRKEFWPYFIVKSAERTYYGLESEMEHLETFLNNCFDPENKNTGKLVKKIFA